MFRSGVEKKQRNNLKTCSLYRVPSLRITLHQVPSKLHTDESRTGHLHMTTTGRINQSVGEITYGLIEGKGPVIQMWKSRVVDTFHHRHHRQAYLVRLSSASHRYPNVCWYRSQLTTARRRRFDPLVHTRYRVMTQPRSGHHVHGVLWPSVDSLHIIWSAHVTLKRPGSTPHL